MQDLSVLQVPVVVLAVVLLLTVVARWTGVPAPMLWLVGGVGLAFVPWTSTVSLPPEVVLLLFLPVLLFWESLTTSLREIRANLRVVVLHAVPLVLATAATVAVVGHLLGLSWAVAWVLGAVVAPTDATAVTAVARGLPRRQLTTLRAESLINDGTALTVFAIAVAAATGEETFSWASAVAGSPCPISAARWSGWWWPGWRCAPDNGRPTGRSRPGSRSSPRSWPTCSPSWWTRPGSWRWWSAA